MARLKRLYKNWLDPLYTKALAALSKCPLCDWPKHKEKTKNLMLQWDLSGMWCIHCNARYALSKISDAVLMVISFDKVDWNLVPNDRSKYKMKFWKIEYFFDAENGWFRGPNVYERIDNMLAVKPHTDYSYMLNYPLPKGGVL